MYPLTKPQKLIYDMEKYAGGAVAVICGSVLFREAIETPELKAAVAELFRLNDALRIRIVETSDGPLQSVLPFEPSEPEILQFESRDGLHVYAEAYAKEPIPLDGPLCEIKLVQLPDACGVLIKLHHIIGDAWTLALLGNQLSQLLRGETPSAHSYLEYIQSEAAYLQSRRYTKDRAFFLEQFKQCDEATYLSEKPAKEFFAARKQFIVSSSDAAAIKRYAAARGISPYMLFMTALAVYFNRVKMNVEHFYLGTALVNRAGLAEQHTAGMFVNTIPVLIKLDNDSSFDQNLKAVSETLTAVMRHQKYNYGDTLADIRKEFGFGERLYDVMLSYQNATINGGGNTESSWYHNGVQTESLQIHIDDRDAEGSYRILYDYQTEKYTEADIESLHTHLCNLLLAGLEHSDKKLYELKLLSSDEQQKLLYDFNDTAVEYPWDKCVHTLFEEQVARTPDKTAVIACDRTLTYAELNEQANRIAHSLIERGIGVGDIVAFALSRRSYLLATMLGILKSGAAYLPIDPNYPQARIDYMLQDSRAKMLITNDNITELHSAYTFNPRTSVTAENLCYCIYTSGSTGSPKGTLLTHKNVGNYANNNIVHRIITQDYKRIVSVTTVGFDIFVTESLLPLLNGLEILLANEEQSTLQEALNRLLERYPVDVIQTTPTKMNALISNKSQDKYLQELKAIILGGEPLDDVLVNKLNSRSNAKIYNIYGPTETTVWVSNAKVDVCSNNKRSVRCVYDCFVEQSEKTPNSLAVIFKDVELTYSQLQMMVEKYASRLNYVGISKGDVVAIHLNRSHKIIAFQLAVINIGAIFLPVDKRYPSERIHFMCNDCNVKLFITDEELMNVPITNALQLSAFEKLPVEGKAEHISNAGECYIIYTSGSTGKPKGCILTSTGLVNFCKNNNTLTSLERNRRYTFASVNSVSFDYFIAESLLPLLNGHTSVVLDDEESTSQKLFLQCVATKNINVLMTTPTRLKMFFFGHENKEILKRLALICSSGEPLSVELLSVLRKYAPNAEIFNPLGPSECTVWNVGGELDKKSGTDIHIGKPIANTQIYIVDKYMQPVPIGVTGELCIAGDGVGAGYLNRPELTAERFVDNPFGAGKLYKTGDLVYWREDGNIVYVGRNDFQVKIRGLRIELGEIENAISAINGIGQAVAVVRKDESGRQLICAFYTGAELPAKEIRKAIGEKLPRYMLPHVITCLDTLPLTTSGKVNRKALPELDLSNLDSETEYVTPVGELETTLATLMEKVLQVSPIGRDDDFFNLGGDSLKAIEFVSLAHQEGIEFPLQAIFDASTVRQLAERISQESQQYISYRPEDFTEIHELLAKNRMESAILPQHTPLGNILLSGATGFLGAHILADYLEHDEGIAYCLVRGKNLEDSEKRLHELLAFYFENRYADCNRIRVLCADLQKDHFGLSDTQYMELLGSVETVINAAASVKHYGSYSDFYAANVITAKRMVSFCLEARAKLIHVSTTSVSGNDFDLDFSLTGMAEESSFTEQDLYIGQSLENVYVRSKFEAEKAVLDAVCRDGLRANIMRMGNLANRYSDGKFQRNHASNAFLKRMKAVVELCVVPDYLLDLHAEFTPIDCAAAAIMEIARHFDPEKTVFHIENPHWLQFRTLFAYFRELGVNIASLSGEDFKRFLLTTKGSPQTEQFFEAFVDNLDESNRLVFNSDIHIQTDFTVDYLKALGFLWPKLTREYIKKYVDYFKNIGYWRV